MHTDSPLWCISRVSDSSQRNVVGIIFMYLVLRLCQRWCDEEHVHLGLAPRFSAMSRCGRLLRGIWEGFFIKIYIFSFCFRE